jgi:hypothetical protein
MALAIVAVVLFVAAAVWSVIDAAQNPNRWRGLFNAPRARRLMAAVGSVVIAAAVGAALAGGVETAVAILAFGALVEMLLSRMLFLAWLNRWLD